METFAELYAAVGKILPNAMIEEDENGQLVIHTNLRETGGKLVEIDPEEGVE